MGRLRDILQKYIKEDQLFDTVEYFKDNDIQYLYPTNKYCFLMKVQKNNPNDNLLNNNIILRGGDEYTLDFKLNKIKYQVNVDEYSDMIYTQSNNKDLLNKDKYKKINIDDVKMKENPNKKTISFIKFNSIKDERGDYKENDHCGVLIIDYLKKTSTIQSLTNYTNCVKCLTNNEIFFKIGDILTQLMIIMSIKNNLKYIFLTDNSYLLCKKSKMQLIHLRTMTHGKPYYLKYGFVPTDEIEKKILNDNLINFKKNISLKKEELVGYFNYRNFNTNKDDNMLNYINNILIPRLKKINLVSDIIKSIIDDKTKESCSLLYNIYMKIYEDIGYVKYEDKEFVLDLNKTKIKTLK
jgi:hypothetical protein